LVRDVSVTCEVEVPDPVFSTPFVADGDAITVDVDLLDYLSDGLDFGVARNWSDAAGGVFDVPGWRDKEEVRKLKLERGIGRQEEARKEREKEARTRGLLAASQRLRQSRRQMKRRRNLSALHGRVKRRNRVSDQAKLGRWIHKFTTQKAKSHGLIGLEGLGIQNLTASYRPSSAWSEAGTAEEPGTNVAAKAALNRNILGASPGLTKTLMHYKGDRYGCLVVLVPPAFSSQYCSACRKHPKDDPATRHLEHGRVSQERFVCPLCGHAMHADHKAARNIPAGSWLPARYGALVLAGCVVSAPRRSLRRRPSGRRKPASWPSARPRPRSPRRPPWSASAWPRKQVCYPTMSRRTPVSAR
jgi:transposase